ncbi:MAG: hypothetical protein Q9M50_12605 [Methylococcales bacterium]|nr:hypothetical protein [Methylococcales bacterium]
MADKMMSKHLVNLENHFATTQPTLKKASQIFHQLDELEYELGLLNDDESTACKSSWWPIVSLIGGTTPVKNDFIEHYLGSTLHNASVYASQHKFTVLQHTPQATVITLPGMAVDVDHKLPFYQISHKVEQAAPGEGNKINAYLELKTLNSDKLQGKLFIDTPPFTENSGAVQTYLMNHVVGVSDLSFVFTDFFESDPELIKDFIDELVKRQDTQNLVFIIDHSDMTLDIARSNEIINSWRQRLENLGLTTGHYVVLSDSDNSQLDGIKAIDERLANVGYNRSYRVLNNLEKSIHDVEAVYIPEVETALLLWKERSNASTLIVMGFFVSLMLFAEITMGGIVLNSIVDPVVGPIILLVLVSFLIPLHVMVSKIHAKFIIKDLYKREKKLNLTESLVGLFEKSLSFGRIILPQTEPFGYSRKNRKKLKSLIDETKELVQSLNESFSHIIDAPLYSNTPDSIPTPLVDPIEIPKERPKSSLFSRRSR